MKQPHKLTVHSDLSETVPYDLPDMRLYTFIDDLARFDYRMPCHWHRDFEFVHVVSGAMTYVVDGQPVELAAGDGLFVNSRRLHYGCSPQRSDCRYPVVVVSPEIFEQAAPSLAASMSPCYGPEAADFLRLDRNNPMHARIMGLVDETVRLQLADEPLQALGVALQLCGLTLPLAQADAATADTLDGANETDGTDESAVARTRRAEPSDNRRDRMEALTMTGFIQRHFRERISLDDIAASGAMGRARCCRVFRDVVGRSPNEYLTDYRIERATRMLADSAASVTEVSQACGFTSANYFIRVFRRRLGMTPRAWREANPGRA